MKASKYRLLYQFNSLFRFLVPSRNVSEALHSMDSSLDHHGFLAGQCSTLHYPHGWLSSGSWHRAVAPTLNELRCYLSNSAYYLRIRLRYSVLLLTVNNIFKSIFNLKDNSNQIIAISKICWRHYCRERNWISAIEDDPDPRIRVRICLTPVV